MKVKSFANLAGFIILFISNLQSRAYEFKDSIDTTLEALKTTDSFLSLFSSKSLKSPRSLVRNIGDINADGIDDLMISNVHPIYDNPEKWICIVFGSKSNPSSIDLDNLLANGQGFTIKQDNYSRIYDMGPTGDINNDGINDFMFSLPCNAYVIFGRDKEFTNIDLNNLTQTQGFQISTNCTNSNKWLVFGSEAGDFNNDGIDDIMVVQDRAESPLNRSRAGSVYILFGHPGTFSDVNLTEFTSGTQGLKIIGAQADDWIGSSMNSAGDFNGDGIDDVVISIGSFMDVSPNKNKVYVVYGHEGEFQDLDPANLARHQGFLITDREIGEQRNVWFINNIGDFNGDGLIDIAFTPASLYGSLPTIVYVIFGVKSGYDNFDINDLQDTQGLKVVSKMPFGYLAPAHGDVNGDGISDLLIQFWSEFRILFGRKDKVSTINLDNLTSGDGFKINVTDSDGPSFSVDCLDFNGDGALDLVFGTNTALLIYGGTINRNPINVVAIVVGIVVPCVVILIGTAIYIRRRRNLRRKANHENKKKMKPISQIPGQDLPTALSWPTSPVASPRENEPIFFNTRETEAHQRGLGVPERLIQLAPNMLNPLQMGENSQRDEEGEEQQNEQALALSSILEQAGQDEEAPPEIFTKSN